MGGKAPTELQSKHSLPSDAPAHGGGILRLLYRYVIKFMLIAFKRMYCFGILNTDLICGFACAFLDSKP